MYEFETVRIYPDDKEEMDKVAQLLAREGIKKDANLDYTMGLFRGEQLIATGSFYKNTLRCMAVDADCQGEGLLNTVVTHLLNVQYQQGNIDVFLYTKCDKAKFFADLGFYEIARVDGLVVFMENRANGFKKYLDNLAAKNQNGAVIAGIIMNANPFTLGHQYLLEKAAAESDVLHVFVVSEEASLVPFAVRRELVRLGVSHLKNVVLHETGSYLISSATFPSYFIKDSDAVIEAHAKLDIVIFRDYIAKALGITKRYVGEEPFSHVTCIYNSIMQSELEKAGLECIVVPRRQIGEMPVSASRVRQLIHDGDLEGIKRLVPKTTYDFFVSPEGAAIVKKIQKASEIIHY